MPKPPSPVIVVPGLTASDLHDEYELPPEAVWSTLRKKRHERITLHATNSANRPASRPGGRSRSSTKS